MPPRARGPCAERHNLAPLRSPIIQLNQPQRHVEPLGPTTAVAIREASASWSLNLTFGPTLARMSGGSAVVDDDGLVELKWQTGLEVDNLGFNIYREEGGQRTRVNKDIIAGSAINCSPGNRDDRGTELPLGATPLQSLASPRSTGSKRRTSMDRLY